MRALNAVNGTMEDNSYMKDEDMNLLGKIGCSSLTLVVKAVARDLELNFKYSAL